MVCCSCWWLCPLPRSMYFKQCRAQCKRLQNNALLCSGAPKILVSGDGLFWELKIFQCNNVVKRTLLWKNGLQNNSKVHLNVIVQYTACSSKTKRIPVHCSAQWIEVACEFQWIVVPMVPSEFQWIAVPIAVLSTALCIVAKSVKISTDQFFDPKN